MSNDANVPDFLDGWIMLMLILVVDGEVVALGSGDKNET